MSALEPPTVNVAGALCARARERPDAAALHLPLGRGSAITRTWRTLSWAELDSLSTRVASGLAAAGLQEGMRAALMVPPSAELFGLVFGLFKAGVVPVMIDPGIGLARMGECLRQARPDAIVGVPAAQALRVLRGWGRASIRRVVTVGRRWFWGGLTLDRLLAAGSDVDPAVARRVEATDGEEIAAILFTSGATGPPKGVVYRHRHFAAQVRMIGATYGLEPGEVDLPTFPLFALFDPALGLTTVVPRMDFARPARVDPEEIRGCVERFGCTTMFGSPGLLDRITRTDFSDRGGDDPVLPTLRRVITAGAPVAPRILRRMASLLPEGSLIHTPYGATENLPVATIDHREVLAETEALTAKGAGVCVGRPLPGNDVRIIALDDGPIERWRDELELPAGRIGEITNLGPTTTDLYLPDLYSGLNEATAAAKIRHEDGGTRHRMGDVGYLDEGGRLWYCGRKAHRLRTERGELYTVPVEGILNAHQGVRRSALVGVGEPGRQEPVAVLEAEPGSGADRNETMRAVRARAAEHEATRWIRRFLWHEGLPVDIRHNAKIDRPALARWAASKGGG